MADHRFHWVVLLEVPDHDSGLIGTGYWLGPHALDDFMADWSTEIPRFGSYTTAHKAAQKWLADVDGTFTVIPAVEACELVDLRSTSQPDWQ